MHFNRKNCILFQTDSIWQFHWYFHFKELSYFTAKYIPTVSYLNRALTIPVILYIYLHVSLSGTRYMAKAGQEFHPLSDFVSPSRRVIGGTEELPNRTVAQELTVSLFWKNSLLMILYILFKLAVVA